MLVTRWLFLKQNMLLLNPLNMLRCFTTQSIPFRRLDWCLQRSRSERYVPSCCMDYYTHNWIYNGSLPLVPWLLYTIKVLETNHSPLAEPLFFVCNWAYGRYYEIWMCAGNEKNWPFLLGKYSLFPESSEMESDLGWPPRFRHSRWSYC